MAAVCSNMRGAFRILVRSDPGTGCGAQALLFDTAIEHDPPEFRGNSFPSTGPAKILLRTCHFLM